MYDGGCVIIDSATGFIHLVLQVNLNMHKMLNAIHEFEQVCRDNGVIPQVYHSNNAAVFTSEGMAEKLKRFAQIITFAGTGAHHHNGMAKRAIGMITNMVRTMMLRAATHSMADGGYACNVFLQSHATSGNWNFFCGPFHEDEMGTEEVSRLSCLGMPTVCVGQDSWQWKENPKVEATI
jgi:hypothetical protein